MFKINCLSKSLFKHFYDIGSKLWRWIRRQALFPRDIVQDLWLHKHESFFIIMYSILAFPEKYGSTILHSIFRKNVFHNFYNQNKNTKFNPELSVSMLFRREKFAYRIRCFDRTKANCDRREDATVGSFVRELARRNKRQAPTSASQSPDPRFPKNRVLTLASLLQPVPEFFTNRCHKF